MKAIGINNSGQVVGTYDLHGFIWNAGTFSTIDYPGASQTVVTGINNVGSLVGYYYLYHGLTGNCHGFLSVGGNFSSIDYPGATDTFVWGINNSGQMVGYYDIASATHGFLLNGGAFLVIDYPGANSTLPTGINDSGQVVGLYGDTTNHGFLMNGNSFSPIDYPGATQTIPGGINNEGQVVGSYGIGSGPYHGFLDTSGIFSSFDYGYYTYGGGINDKGQIVVGTSNGPSFLITPTPLSAPSIGASGNTLIVGAGIGCTWTAASNVNWIVVTSASSGSGGAQIMYSILPNTTGVARTGALTVGGQTVTISQTATPDITESPAAIGINGITVGPDRAIWFTSFTGNEIARYDGFFSLSYPTSPGPFGIASGPDGQLWFTESNANNIAHTTTAGIKEYAVPTTGAGLRQITAGPDGALWFTESAGNKIGRTTTGGVITEFPLPVAVSTPQGIVAGPDGALWFTEQTSNKIGRITTAGEISEFRVPTAGSGPLGITVGPDGALWFTEQSANKIGRITTGGVASEFPIPTPASGPSGVTAGPDGALWFTEYTGNQIGRIDTSGAITEYGLATTNAGPIAITAGSDGALWFTEYSSGNLGRIVFPTTPVTIQSDPPGLSVVIDGATYSAPQFFNWTAGSQHTVGGVSLIPAGTGTRYVFGSWSDAGAQTHTVTALPGGVYTLTYAAQYLLTTAVSGNGSITLSPSSPDGYYYRGAVTVTAVAAAGYQFVSWGGDVGQVAHNQVVITKPSTAIAYFAATQQTAPTALHFIPVPPCRVADTRLGYGFSGSFGPPALASGATRDFPIPASACGIPATAQAYSLNVTAAPQGPLIWLTAWPTQQPRPVNVSTLNSFDGEVVANAAIVPAGANGSISVYASNPTDVIIDINGYFATFVPPVGAGLAFYPVPPCRVADTRATNGFSGSFGPPSLGSGSTRSLPIPQQGHCGIPSTAQAYALNVTVVPPGPLAYLSVWPAGQTQPEVSTLNSYQGKVVANAAIVPAGTNGAIDVFASDPTDVIVDINGYFAAPGASGGLSFYPAPPCRVADTRGNGFIGVLGPPSMTGGSTRSFEINWGPCAVPAAQAYSLNVTVVPSGPLTYLSAWPFALPQPLVSTLNSFDGRVVANAAIVPAESDSSISAAIINIYVSDLTDVIIDINGYFGQ